MHVVVLLFGIICILLSAICMIQSRGMQPKIAFRFSSHLSPASCLRSNASKKFSSTVVWGLRRSLSYLLAVPLAAFPVAAGSHGAGCRVNGSITSSHVFDLPPTIAQEWKNEVRANVSFPVIFPRQRLQRKVSSTFPTLDSCIPNDATVPIPTGTEILYSSCKNPLNQMGPYFFLLTHIPKDFLFRIHIVIQSPLHMPLIWCGSCYPIFMCS